MTCTINPRSKAAHSGSIEVGDVIESINNRPTQNLDLKAVQDIIYNTKETLHIVLAKSSSLIPNGGTTMSSAEVIDTRLPTSVTSNSKFKIFIFNICPIIRQNKNLLANYIPQKASNLLQLPNPVHLHSNIFMGSPQETIHQDV
ncbi:hypothetical protein BSL78_17669 [Apostichopus japonicus]|uniref:PDZ domain-containing protein n=1 Tax=Stichopus japonicus TaxID=307972 RepID=A0A2G8KBW5_STIJA|nr:hypothetical protein BSL78_17669 [Apostichopus japonicus]